MNQYSKIKYFENKNASKVIKKKDDIINKQKKKRS